MSSLITKDFVRQNYSAYKYNLNMINVNLNMLCEFLQEKNIKFEHLYKDYLNFNNSDEWKLEKEIHETESEELIKEFYSTTKFYLYELTLHECRWQYMRLFKSIAKFAKKYNIKRAIDFGGGVGGLTAYLNLQGIYCDYADILGLTWDFAKHRFSKESMNVLQLTEDNLREKSHYYDLIVSLDCLEHLKHLENYIKLFNAILRNNGLLIAKSSFFGDGIHLQSNHKYNSLKELEVTMDANGFFLKGWLVERLGRNIIIPKGLIKLLNVKVSSGKKLIFQKKTHIADKN